MGLYNEANGYGVKNRIKKPNLVGVDALIRPRDDEGIVPYDIEKGIYVYMKATGIVRRTEARVIITQKLLKAL